MGISEVKKKLLSCSYSKAVVITAPEFYKQLLDFIHEMVNTEGGKYNSIYLEQCYALGKSILKKDEVLLILEK